MIKLNRLEQNLCNLILPVKTESYTPIPHFEFINNLQKSCVDNKYEITDKKYWSNSKGSKLIGRYTLNYEESDDMNMKK